MTPTRRSRPKRGSTAWLGLSCLVVSTACGGTENAAPRDAGSGACEFSIDARVSEVIPTVGIVTWSTTLDEVDAARIEFGLDEDYAHAAPVDLAEPEFRTVLLGMKADRTYQARVVAEQAGRECTSPDFTLRTGSLPNGLPPTTVSNERTAAPAPGFIISSFLLDGPAFILDADGDYVWWYGSGEIGRAALSPDGKYMWYAAVNVAGGAGSMKRVTLDGVSEQDLSAEFGEVHHDFTILPDGTVAYLQHDGELDRVVERAPDGSQRVAFSVSEVTGGTAKNHANSLKYWPADESYTVSDLAQNAYVKVSRSGERRWLLGGAASDFTGDGASWEGQHGHQLLAEDRLLFFNNGPTGGTSSALEVALDFERMTATRVWEYPSDRRTLIYGDVQRLENENTLVTFSVSGILQEVNPEGELVRKLSFALGGAVGYSAHQPSLYPPVN
jgi:hypothetical protein